MLKLLLIYNYHIRYSRISIYSNAEGTLTFYPSIIHILKGIIIQVNLSAHGLYKTYMSKLIYSKPATEWEEALPLGNSHMGAMLFGHIQNERIQLNEENMWYGAPMDRNNPDTLKYLPEIRKLIFDGQISKAEKLMSYAMTGCPESMSPYQTFGDLYINITHSEDANNIASYKRFLDIDNSIYYQEYKMGSTIYKRQAFMSFPDNILVIKFDAEGDGTLSLDAVFRRERFFTGSQKIDNNGTCIWGQLGDNGISYAGMLLANANSGKLYTIGEKLIAEDVKDLVMIIRLVTGDNTNTLLKILKEDLNNKLSISYDELKKRHIEDYKRLYDRVDFSLKTSNSYEDIDTDQRIKDITTSSDDINLAKLYFDYGRYLLISCSRIGGLPANLQGIWCKDMTPPWDSKYTVNINMQMNYWPAEICNLSECHMPVFDLMEKIYENGKVTAKTMYGCRGYVCHHNTNGLADTAPQDLWIPASYWVMAAAWLCTHIWTHYTYTQDIDFLKEKYHLIKEAVLFFEDFLVEHEGYLVTCPSVSPENTFILENGEKGCNIYGVTMDNQLLRDLFNICIDSARLLNTESDEYLSKLASMKDKLLPTQIASNGTIMEWPKEFKEDEPGHRHISHLYGLHPSDQITVDGTPLLAKAASKTLENRLAAGGGHTGWSKAWIINHYAKLWDKDNAYKNLISLFNTSTYPNMFDKHPPFQIDGNFGATAGIANMLLQSNKDRIILLPALPDKWTAGHITGLKAYGNLTIDLEWENNKLTKCIVTAGSDVNTCIKYNNRNEKINLKSGESYDFFK